MFFNNEKFSTPILLLGFNRPDCFFKVLKRILKQNPTKLYIALDGPRNDQDRNELETIKSIVSKIPSKIGLRTLYRDSNLGCGRAVSSAITWFFENEEMGIILEDDTLPNDTFFKFCEQMLYLYKDEPRVGHISGNSFLPYDRVPKFSFWFSCYNHIWGWATWRRVWSNYNFELDSISEKQLVNSLLSYKYGDKFVSYWLNIYKKMIKKEIDTWDYQYTLMCLAKSYLTTIPRYNLVDNIGFDYRATHTKSKKPISILKTKNYKLTKYKTYPELSIFVENDIFVNKVIFGID